MINEGIKKVKREEGIFRQMAMTWTWTEAAKNCLSMKNSFSPNQLVFGRNPILTNLIRENNPSSLERGREEENLRGTWNAIHKSRVVHIQQKSKEITTSSKTR